MSRAFFALIVGWHFVGSVFSQTELDPNEGLIIVQNEPADFGPRWWSHLGKTYFVQCSVDLVTWTWCPEAIFTGGNNDGTGDGIFPSFPDVIHFDVSGTETFFLRLVSTPQTDSDPVAADFDGDKVGNGVETNINTHPLSFGDTDGDGISDDWETRWGLNPKNPIDGAVDTDGDEIINIFEYQAAGAEGTDPTDFYDGNWPTLEIISGNTQTAEPGTFSPVPLIVELKHGATPVNHGPIKLYVEDGSSGQISETNNGTGLATTLNLWTGTDGRVTVDHKNADTVTPNGDLPFSFINARVGSTAASGRSYNVRALFVEFTQVNYPYPNNTVGLHASEAIDNRIAGKSPSAALPVFAAGTDHNAAVYVRNTSSWCFDLRQQMTCISPWNEGPGSAGIFYPGTAITAQHVISARHVHLANGVIIRFITADNVVVERTIRGSADHPALDVSVHTLGSALPATITPCNVLPANYGDYLSYVGGGRPPVMMLDYEENALVYDLRELGVSANYIKPSFHADRVPFNQRIVSGDSGNPAFLIINDTLVLLSVAHLGTPSNDPTITTEGSFVTNANPTLNEMIVEADADATASRPDLPPINTGLQVQTIDLSGFSMFTPP